MDQLPPLTLFPTHESAPSDIRQVPDNQEVFIDDASDASLILELLDLERDKEGLEVGNHFPNRTLIFLYREPCWHNNITFCVGGVCICVSGCEGLQEGKGVGGQRGNTSQAYFPVNPRVHPALTLFL